MVDGAPDRFRFKVIAQLSNDWSISVYLDTRGDPGAEYRMRNFEAFGLGRCRIWRLQNGDPRPVPCGRKSIDDVLLRGSGGESRHPGSRPTRSSGGTLTRMMTGSRPAGRTIVHRTRAGIHSAAWGPADYRESPRGQAPDNGRHPAGDLRPVRVAADIRELPDRPSLEIDPVIDSAVPGASAARVR